MSFFHKIRNFFKINKEPQTPQFINWAELLPAQSQEEQYANISEPKTLAQIRLNGGAKDNGAIDGARLYGMHKVKVQNQWINPLQSVNSGWGNAHLSGFIYQPVDYYQCYKLAQDPMFNKIFNILSKTPFANGGNVAPALNDEEQKSLEIGIRDYHVMEAVVDAVRSNYVCGGCLVYMDFGLDNLTEPLDLNKVDMRDFKGFRHIDPINVTAVNVNTTEPARGDYMEPETWYIIGLGNVHKSHLLKFEDNVPELIMRPMCMYLGMPLTQLIKQDIANSNLASQGLANLLNRFRLMYLRAPSTNFVGDGARNFRQRLEAMSALQDNFDIFALMQDEDMQQFTTSVTGLNECVEFFYQIIAAKTDITMSILMGKGASGLSGTLEGERKNFYDRLRNIQQAVKPNLLKMLGIVYGAINDGNFKKFENYIYEPLEQATGKEIAENVRSYAEVGKALVELGASNQDVMEWLKGFKDFHLDNVEIDTETQGLEGYDGEEQGADEEESPESALKVQNDWITVHPHGKDVKGNPVFVGEGESKIEAIERRFGKSGKDKNTGKTLYDIYGRGYKIGDKDETGKYKVTSTDEWASEYDFSGKRVSKLYKSKEEAEQVKAARQKRREEMAEKEAEWDAANPDFNDKERVKEEFLKVNPDAKLTDYGVIDGYAYIRTSGGFLPDEDYNDDAYIDGVKLIHINPSLSELKAKKKDRSRENKATAMESLRQRAEYEVLDEREKAVKLKKDGVEFWVKKTSIRPDGTLKPAAVKELQASQKGEGFLDKVKRRETLELRFKDNLKEKGVTLKGRPDWESEKAVGYDINVDFFDIEKTKRARVFIPKSQIQGGKIPSWLLERKTQELNDALREKYPNSGGFSFELPAAVDFEGEPYVLNNNWGWEKDYETINNPMPEAEEKKTNNEAFDNIIWCVDEQTGELKEFEE